MEPLPANYYYPEQRAYGNPEDEVALHHCGSAHQMNPSSSFASRSPAQELPWDTVAAQPGPGAYSPRMSSPRRQQTAPSASFASTTRRFAADKSWDELDSGGGTTLRSGARMDGGMGYHRGNGPGGARPSAVFASATPRFEAEPSRSPELGQFDPAAAVELRRTAPGRSAHGNPATSMASSSERRLPFEHATISPSPASYSPRRTEDLRPSRSSRLDLTDPRFRAEIGAGTPGPADYSPRHATLSRSTAPARSSTAFASRTERFASPRRGEVTTPGPGAWLGSGSGLTLR